MRFSFVYVYHIIRLFAIDIAVAASLHYYVLCVHSWWFLRWWVPPNAFQEYVIVMCWRMACIANVESDMVNGE